MRSVLTWKNALARMRTVKHRHKLQVALLVVMAGMFMPVDAARSDSDDPPVPAGRDPGGFPVAIIGNGIDYTLRNIGQMLARDGEGEIIGYDLIDDDRRPFAIGAETDAAEILLGEGQAATLVVIRATVTQQKSLAQAVGYATKSPARIIAIFGSAADPSVVAVVTAAAIKFPQHLFIILLEAGAVAADMTAHAPNLLVVTNAIAAEAPSHANNNQLSAADVAIETSGLWERPASLPEAIATPALVALARTAALAARLVAVDSRATAAEIKSRIVALAVPSSDGRQCLAKNGCILQPRRHFWLE